MPEYIRRLDEKQPSAGREILITFDDAYSNFYELAAPLLSDFGFTATIFVPTDFIAERPRWFERDRAAIIPFLRGFGFNTDDLTAIEHMTESVTQRPLMTAPQMQELRAAGFDFHSHSAAHAFLPSLPTEVLTADLDRSARCLADLFGPYRLVLCYPYGASDERVHTAARKAGFVAGFGATYHARLQDRFNIARVGVAGGLGLFHFRFGLSSALDSYAALR
jgi:peptidoglycan/xylan/chitin deacetylase (PgdA/CDA1 family)